MSEPELAVYSPSRNAGVINPAYPGSFVVESVIPVSKITFNPAYDKLPDYAHRDADRCPEKGGLIAVADTPQIRGYETRQSLSVPCNELAYVIGPDRASSFQVCKLKAAQVGADVGDIPGEFLDTGVDILGVRCPFSFLGGVVMAGDKHVDVGITAVNHDADEYRTV